MDATKRETLEAAGWIVGDAADFLEMSDEEANCWNRACSAPWRTTTPCGGYRFRPE